MRTNLSLLSGIIISALSTFAYALPSDISQPIRIEADSAVRDEGKGQTIYQGDVKISQGSLVITAERIAIQDTNSQPDSIIASGAPATLSQQLTAEGERVYASALRIEYVLSSGKVEFKQQAKMSQGGSKISSETISYNVKEQIINAQSSGQGSRVEMVIPAQIIPDAEPVAEDKE